MRRGAATARTLAGIVIAIVVAAVVVLLVMPMFHGGHAEYRTAQVTRGEIVSKITATGTVYPIKELPYATPTAGKVTKVHVKHNEEVKKGQVLAEIDPLTGPSGTNKIIAQEDGIVLVVEPQLKEGESVGDHTPAFRIASDLGKEVHVEASIPQSDRERILEAQRTGQPVTFKVDAYRGEEFQGKIDEVRMNPTVKESVVTYPVVVAAAQRMTKAADGKESPKLCPGMTATVTFQIAKKTKVLKVPTAALRFIPKPPLVRPDERRLLEGGSNQHVVWTVDGDLLRGVKVETGMTDSTHTEITSGELSDGQTIVIGAK